MSGKCCICGGDNGPLVGSFPEVVVKTLIQRAENVTSESCVCNPCVKEIGMTWGFRRDVNSRDCASLNYDCKRQTRKTRRVKSLRPVSDDGRVILGVPMYAPENCICTSCYSHLRNATKCKRDSPSTPVKRVKQQTCNHTSLTMEELQDSLISSINDLPASNRLPILEAMLERHSKSDIERLFRLNKIRSQLHRILSPTTPSWKSGNRSLAQNITEWWISEASEPDESRKERWIIRDGESIKVFRRWCRHPYQHAWSEYCKYRGEVSHSYFMSLRPRNICRIPSSTRCHCRWHLACYRKLQAHQKIRLNGIPKLKGLKQLTEFVLCQESYLCAFGICKTCNKLETLFPNNLSAADLREEVTFLDFQNVTEGAVKLLKSVEKTLPLCNFLLAFKKEVLVFTKHQYANKCCDTARRQLLENLPAGHCVIFVDYSAKFVHSPIEQLQQDNYQKKKSSILVFLVGKKISTEKHPGWIIQYTTHYYISNNLTQTFPAVCKALSHLLDTLQDDFAHFHIFSDGGNHFKVKYMLGWMAAIDIDVTWDCFPTGHGKGPWDSEGYQLKRFALDIGRSVHRYNLTGEISDAKSLFEVARTKMTITDSSKPISERVFNFLPDITDISPRHGEIILTGIRSNFFSFRSLVRGYQNEVQDFTMGYRAVSCFCTLCITGDYDLCEQIQGSVGYKIVTSHPPSSTSEGSDSTTEESDSTSSEYEKSSISTSYDDDDDDITSCGSDSS